ncbi:MAG TPA: sigma-70 family RNA polymerase sigma factor [Planctomycetota bacterium]|nr:sigma-70 family RNA polymerase sigma factor [Planctomycetota bacterium]
MHEQVSSLVLRASRGDSTAIETLLAQHLPALRAFVRLKAGALLLQRESCSDLAQSVCRDVLEHADRFRFGGTAEFRKWLFTTAMRKIADRYEHWRAEKRDPGREQSADEQALEGYRAFCTPSRHAAAREELATVELAFGQLAEEKQEVIIRARLFGMAHAEIAAELGKTEGAVRTMLSRALAELAEHL